MDDRRRGSNPRGESPALGITSAPTPMLAATPPPVVPSRRPIIETTSPERYRVQFTIGKESHEKLRRVQALLRREIPSGDPGAIFDRALTLLLEKVERTKLGASKKPRPRPIRPGTDRQLRTPIVPSRDLPRHVQRAVCQRDSDQCAFVSGRRPPVHGTHVPGVPSHRAVCKGRTGHRREHLPALPAPQPIRGGAGLRRAQWLGGS